MKTLLMIVIVVVVALVAFNYLTTGDLKLLPGDSMTDEEHVLNGLKGDFRAAARAYRQAGKSAAVSGMDTTHEASAALADVDRVEKEVRQFKTTASTQELKIEADKLLKEIAQYKADVR